MLLCECVPEGVDLTHGGHFFRAKGRILSAFSVVGQEVESDTASMSKNLFYTVTMCRSAKFPGERSSLPCPPSPGASANSL